MWVLYMVNENESARALEQMVMENRKIMAYGALDRRFTAWREVAQSWSAGRSIVVRLLTVSTAEAFATWRENAAVSAAVMSLTQKVKDRRSKETMSLVLEVRARTLLLQNTVTAWYICCLHIWWVM
jgi:hypothetical protein